TTGDAGREHGTGAVLADRHGQHARAGAVGLAAVERDVVAVIAGLAREVLDVAVAAGRGLAGVDAAVLIVDVAVVAVLHADPDDPVTAARGRAGVEAAVGVDPVAVVALLTGLHDAVAAAGQAAGVGALVVVDVVAVVAALARIDDAVTTHGLGLVAIAVAGLTITITVAVAGLTITVAVSRIAIAITVAGLTVAVAGLTVAVAGVTVAVARIAIAITGLRASHLDAKAIDAGLTLGADRSADALGRPIVACDRRVTARRSEHQRKSSCDYLRTTKHSSRILSERERPLQVVVESVHRDRRRRHLARVVAHAVGVAVAEPSVAPVTPAAHALILQHGAQVGVRAAAGREEVDEPAELEIRGRHLTGLVADAVGVAVAELPLTVGAPAADLAV